MLAVAALLVLVILSLQHTRMVSLSGFAAAEALSAEKEAQITAYLDMQGN